MGKIGIKTLDVSGFIGAFHGMRAPMQSYHLSDSKFGEECDCEECAINDLVGMDKSQLCHWGQVCTSIGEKDMDLAKRLIKGGNEHAKFRRMIHVQAEISMPRYWWSEQDTYKIATTANSESTMHKLLNNNNPITEEQFYFGEDSLVAEEVKKEVMPVIEKLEDYRQQYKGLKPTKFTKNQLLVIAKRILPECFIQTRTWDGTYQTLYEEYRQRVKTPHRLKEEWIDTLGKWIETLPYAKELIIGDN